MSAPLDPYMPKYVASPTKAPKTYGHPGFAWAATRNAIQVLGGLIDYCIVGSADTLMAYALIGELDQTTIPIKELPEYYELLSKWQETAVSNLRKKVHYVKGLLVHFWHGTRQSRDYFNRNFLLVKHKYNPHKDVHFGKDGLLCIKMKDTPLEKDLKEYFDNRKEDE